MHARARYRRARGRAAASAPSLSMDADEPLAAPPARQSTTEDLAAAVGDAAGAMGDAVGDAAGAVGGATKRAFGRTTEMGVATIAASAPKVRTRGARAPASAAPVWSIRAPAAGARTRVHMTHTNGTTPFISLLTSFVGECALVARRLHADGRRVRRCDCRCDLSSSSCGGAGCACGAAGCTLRKDSSPRGCSRRRAAHADVRCAAPNAPNGASTPATDATSRATTPWEQAEAHPASLPKALC